MRTFGNSKIDQMRTLGFDNVASNSPSESNKLIQHNSREVLTRSELNDKQIEKITKMVWTAEILDNDMIGEFADQFLHAQISRNRASRREFIENNQSIQTNKENIGLGGLKGYFGKEV